MVPRYIANGTMRQDANGTYVAAADYDRVVESLNELGGYAIDQMKAAERGEITHQAAIETVVAWAVLNYGIRTKT